MRKRFHDSRLTGAAFVSLALNHDLSLSYDLSNLIYRLTMLSRVSKKAGYEMEAASAPDI